MIKWIWDLLFTRSQWTIILKVELTTKGVTTGTRYVLQNQWGQIKQKDIC